MRMLDRGWRRSGVFLYKPDMRRTCCPQYTIRLDALEFAPSRSQRQVTNRWNRFIINGDNQEAQMEVEGAKPNKGKAKAKVPPFELVSAVHSSESEFLLEGSQEPVHRFEVTLEPSTFTDEKFELYMGYQHDIHKEEREKTTSGFRRFLVDSPLEEEPIPYPTPPPSHLPKNFGAYHQCYRVDGELCAMAVLDILPGCVSSVYFMYNKKWERFSLGKVSALREASLAREMYNAGVPSMNHLYMGFYVRSCSKMRYKGEYAPSYLLDPEEYTWFRLNECIPLLDQHRYGCFSRPANSLDEDPGPEDVLNNVPPEVLTNINFLESLDLDTLTVTISPIPTSHGWKRKGSRDLILRGIKALGTELAQEIILHVDE